MAAFPAVFDFSHRRNGFISVSKSLNWCIGSLRAGQHGVVVAVGSNLWPRVTRSVAGHPYALPQTNSQPPVLQLHQWGDAHQAVQGDLHEAQVGEARRLNTNQPALRRAQQPLPLLINPAPQPVESTVAAPRVVCKRAGRKVRTTQAP